MVRYTVVRVARVVRVVRVVRSAERVNRKDNLSSKVKSEYECFSELTEDLFLRSI